MGAAFKYKVALALLVVVFAWLVLAVWQPWKDVLPGPMSSWRWPSFQVTRDTVFVKGPVQYVDRWHERVRYVTQDPDTVQVVVYDQTPPSLDFVSGTITDDGEAYIEVLVDSTTTHVLRGRLAPSGDTYFHPGPDSQLVFVRPRFGFDPAFDAGVGIHGVQASIETFYWNDVPFLGTTAHAPCVDFSVKYAYFRGDEPFDTAVDLGLSASAEVSPFRTPARVGIGGLYDPDLAKLKFNAYLTFELYNP